MAVAVGVIEDLARIWAPSFAGVEYDALFTAYAAVGQRSHTEDAFTMDTAVGSSVSPYVDAMALWVLHWMTLADLESQGMGGAAGPLTAIRTGDESVAFQQASSSGGGGLSPGDIQYMRTSWGQRYIRARDTRPDAHMFVV